MTKNLNTDRVVLLHLLRTENIDDLIETNQENDQEINLEIDHASQIATEKIEIVIVVTNTMIMI